MFNTPFTSIQAMSMSFRNIVYISIYYTLSGWHPPLSNFRNTFHKFNHHSETFLIAFKLVFWIVKWGYYVLRRLNDFSCSIFTTCMFFEVEVVENMRSWSFMCLRREYLIKENKDIQYIITQVTIVWSKFLHLMNSDINSNIDSSIYLTIN